MEASYVNRTLRYKDLLHHSGWDTTSHASLPPTPPTQFDLGETHDVLGFIKFNAHSYGSYTKTVLSPTTTLGVIPYISVWLSSDPGAYRETGYRCASDYMITFQQHTIIPCRSDAVTADPAMTRYVTVVRQNGDYGLGLSLGVSSLFAPHIQACSACAATCMHLLLQQCRLVACASGHHSTTRMSGSCSRSRHRRGCMQAYEVTFFTALDGDTSCACTDTRETPMISGVFAAKVYPSCTSTPCAANLYDDVVTYAAASTVITAVSADARFEYDYGASIAPGHVKVVSARWA